MAPIRRTHNDGAWRLLMTDWDKVYAEYVRAARGHLDFTLPVFDSDT